MTDTDPPHLADAADMADSAQNSPPQMSDTSTSTSQALQPLLGLPDAPAPVAKAPEPESEYEPGKVLTFRMALFHPGAKVRLKGQGREEVVSHIMVRKQLLSVHLVGREIAVRPEDLEIKPTVFSTQRRPEPLLI